MNSHPNSIFQLALIFGTTLLMLAFTNFSFSAPKENLTVSVTANMSFIDPIVITENSALQFGSLSIAMATNDTITIGTDDSLGGDTQLVISGGQSAADLTVTSSSTANINILISSIVDGPGYSLSNFICEYNSGTPTACGGVGFNVSAAPSAPLKIGATLTGNGLDTVGVANGSFDVVINYQ